MKDVKRLLIVGQCQKVAMLERVLPKSGNACRVGCYQKVAMLVGWGVTKKCQCLQGGVLPKSVIACRVGCYQKVAMLAGWGG